MSTRGFSLVELLIALTVCALLSGAVVGVMAPARAAFETIPAALDLQQRARSGLDLLSAAIRSAGATVGAAAELGGLASAMPMVWPLPSGGAFAGVLVISVPLDGAQGVLALDQPGPSGPLTLRSAPSCPRAGGVCGFQGDAVAAIVDGRGPFEVFTVASADGGRQQLLATAPLAFTHRAGAVLVEVEVSRFELRAQPDGSQSLVRITSGGATQPIIDGVVEMGLDAFGETAPAQVCEPRPHLESPGDAGAMARMTPSDFDDGPWCPGRVDGETYDADLFRLRRLDVWLRVEVLQASLRGPAGTLFRRRGTAAATAAQWVPDRLVKMSVALRNTP